MDCHLRGLLRPLRVVEGHEDAVKARLLHAVQALLLLAVESVHPHIERPLTPELLSRLSHQLVQVLLVLVLVLLLHTQSIIILSLFCSLQVIVLRCLFHHLINLVNVYNLLFKASELWRAQSAGRITWLRRRGPSIPRK